MNNNKNFQMQYLIDDLPCLVSPIPIGLVPPSEIKQRQNYTVVTSELDYNDYDEKQQRVGTLLLKPYEKFGKLYQHMIASIIWFLETKPSKTLVVFLDRSLDWHFKKLSLIAEIIREYDPSMFYIPGDPNGLLLGFEDKQQQISVHQPVSNHFVDNTYEDPIVFRFGRVNRILRTHDKQKKLFVPCYAMTYDTKQNILLRDNAKDVEDYDFFASRYKEIWSNENLKQAAKHVKYRVSKYERDFVESHKQIGVDRVINVYTTNEQNLPPNGVSIFWIDHKGLH